MVEGVDPKPLLSCIYHLPFTIHHLPFTIYDLLIMFLAKVVGTVWSTKKTPDLEGVRFLVVHPYDLEKEPTRNIVIVADRLGAGTGEMVMCAFGKAARSAIGNQDMAIEAAVVGIVDRVDITEPVSEEMRDAAVRLARDNGRR
jgi:microcompartment protein CcmK/EutM